MPSYPDPTSPPWNESDSFRETTLHLFDPPDREAVRRMGQVLYDLAVFADREEDDEESVTRVELRAVAADLRYTSGYLSMVRRSAKECDLDPEDDKLARFAGKLARRVGAIATAIEGRLS